MSIQELEHAIQGLSPDELARFSAWFDRYMEGVWDRRIEGDVAAGRLDDLAAEANREFEAGRCKPL